MEAIMSLLWVSKAMIKKITKIKEKKTTIVAYILG